MHLSIESTLCIYLLYILSECYSLYISTIERDAYLQARTTGCTTILGPQQPVRLLQRGEEVHGPEAVRTYCR